MFCLGSCFWKPLWPSHFLLCSLVRSLTSQVIYVHEPVQGLNLNRRSISGLEPEMPVTGVIWPVFENHVMVSSLRFICPVEKVDIRTLKITSVCSHKTMGNKHPVMEFSNPQELSSFAPLWKAANSWVWVWPVDASSKACHTD